jgi:hypothetical protein
LTGWFDFFGDGIAGWAEDTGEPGNSDLTVFVVRGREIIASGRVKEKSTTVGWRFAVETGSRVSGDDVLYERVTVLVRDAGGNTQALRLEGSTQLELIREHMANPVRPLLEIDFREGGNSDDFVMEGWSGQEKIHRWTVGMQSALTLRSPPRARDGTYALQLLLWPFVVLGMLTEQRLQVLINDTPIANFSITRQSLLRCAVPSALVSDAPHMIVRFLHQDAMSPASLGVSDDSRLLALAFKRVRLYPVIADDPG